MGQKNDQKNDALKKKDKQLAENLKISYDMAKIQLNDEILRNERLDAKFNFLLVFLAGFISCTKHDYSLRGKSHSNIPYH